MKSEFAMIDQLPSIDWDLAQNLAGGNLQLAQDLFKMLLNSLQQEQMLINTAFKQKQLQELEHLIHKLHGGCCYLGVSKLKTISKILEQAIIHHDIALTTELITALNAEFENLKNYQI